MEKPSGGDQVDNGIDQLPISPPGRQENQHFNRCRSALLQI